MSESAQTPDQAVVAPPHGRIGRRGRIARIWRVLRKAPPTAWFGLIVIGLYLIAAVFAPVIAPYPETELVGGAFEPWGGQFILGTDQLGRDMLSRLIYGARNSVGIAFMTTMVSFLLGGALGLVAAISGGWVDQALSRVVDVLMSIPQLIFALVLLSILGSSIVNLVVRHVRKQVPPYELPGALRFNDALEQGRFLPFEPVTSENRQLTFAEDFLIRRTGTFYLVVGNTFDFLEINELPNIDPIPGAVGNYSFTVKVFDDGDTMMEYWNLVFTQFEVDPEGDPIGDLPAKNVDTGLGLERLAQILQDVPTAYETDSFRPILARAEDVTAHRYGADEKDDISLRILAEHGRARNGPAAGGQWLWFAQITAGLKGSRRPLLLSSNQTCRS